MIARSVIHRVYRCFSIAWLPALLLALLLAMPPVSMAQQSATSDPSTTTTGQSGDTGADAAKTGDTALPSLETQAADPDAEDGPPLEDADATAEVLR